MNTSVLKNKSNIKAWACLPDVNTLSRYFKQSDLIELSKVCKKYSTQLKPQVLKKLFVSYRNLEYFNIGYHYNNGEHEDVLNSLKLGFAGDYHLVKQVIIELNFTTKFACNFFNLFTKLSNIKIHSSRSYDLKSYIEILSNSENLQHITLSCEYKNFDSILDNDHRSFFYRLKSIEIYVPCHIVNDKSPFEIIDPSFTNLKRLTVLNNDMLYKLSNGISSLLCVGFYYNYHFDRIELNKFIRNNPQLKQISISSINLDENVMSSILDLKSLYKLEIMFYCTEVRGFYIDTENYSIKHLIYTGTNIMDYNIVIDVLEMCKNLKIYETSYISDYDYAIIDQFPEIDTLLLKSFSNRDMDILSQKFEMFNQVKFKDGCIFGEIADQLLKFPEIKWVPKQEYTRETNEFTLVKKV
ncbi:hypothetical protein CONCODRAFT_12143 [Conidiobolus coronatus NRRL 28638]|uniref:F-box domain-containing protein n=1 Tax=Conidiobolus coronatus (strain ATCC 28846 / CBS 209.66 / NRRL 28638) TaxID=796925 RepID=A0A137NTM7_CONC2|nr:hypothetical protein CONCODRAFT_12143 [Conidiobolus coronatus NRRL 28638]|eukprot:KXN66089.1 hypothetical protein CONCODRAFT_12143 [Conidiobolus coronatus NRRL 28638]